MREKNDVAMPGVGRDRATWEVGGCTHNIIHGRSINRTDPRSHLYNAGTEHVRFSSNRQRLLAQSAQRGRAGTDTTGQGRTGQDRTGQDRAGQDRTGQDRIEQNTASPRRKP